MPTTPNPHISLKDLAAELGVSISTVSRALKDSPEIGQQMRDRVQALARERNYRPNPFAMSLLKNSPRIIGILVPDLVTHFYASIISGISDVARRHNYSVIITSSYEQYELERQCIDNLLNIRVEGIIACLSQETTDYAHFATLHSLNVPLVFFDRVCLCDRFSSVVADNVESAREATLHLLASGARRVGFLGGSNHLEIVRQRKHGYLEALRQSHLPIEKELVVCGKMTYEEGREAARKLLSLDPRPDAVLAMNDTLAFATLKEIKRLGWRIPQDVALIGYTDEQHANYVEPALTAVTHQTYRMGETACGLLLEQLMQQGETPQGGVQQSRKQQGGSRQTGLQSREQQGVLQQVVVPTHLLIRDSSIK